MSGTRDTGLHAGGDPRRRIPGLDRLLEDEASEGLRARFPRERVVDALRGAVEEVRRELAAGAGPDDVEAPALYAARAARILEARDRPSLRAVVNATGVVLHTNLGRAPLPAAARQAMERVATGYANLEYDLSRGRRGSRYVHCTELLRELTGAEDALVVNNNAAALVLAVNTLARGARVLVSRGELVEIGGGFRIPEILERSGGTLTEVGSTNRTRLEDYRSTASATAPAMILKVHRSNFRITGFTEEVGLADLAGLAGELDVPLVHDLGSGLLADPSLLGLPDEPGPRSSLEAGAHLVAFSADKLLGGPQAGILVGRADVVGHLRENPLCRALRVDKVTLAALAATLALYRSPAGAIRDVPALSMLSRDPSELEARARRLEGRLAEEGVPARAVPCSSVIGGGTYPGVTLPSWGVRIGDPGEAEAVAAALREGEPAVVGRITEGALVLDLRTVDEQEEPVLVRRILESRPDHAPSPSGANGG